MLAKARRPFLAIGVALMLVLAGCGSSYQQSPSQIERSTQTINPTSTSILTSTPIPTATPTPTPTTTQAESREKSLDGGNVTYYNATESDLQAINETMAHFFENLPENKSERTAKVAEIASKSCDLPPINETLFRSAEFTHKRGQQLYHVARVMQGNFNNRINPVQIRSAAQTSAKIGQYTTIVGTYNEYHRAACAFDRDKPETVEDYYLASAALGFELLMFQYGMYYKTAFKANRVLSHHRTYRVVQSTFGDEALGLMMSGSYWLVHGSLQSAPKYVRNHADEANITLSSDTPTKDHQRLEQFVGTKVIPRNLTKTASKCYNEFKGESEDGGGLLDEANDLIEEIEGSFLNGKYTTSEVLESVENIEHSELSEEQVKNIEGCIKDHQSD